MAKRIKSLIVFLRVCIRYFYSGRADKAPENLDSFIVIQNSKLGDMVCTTPVFRAIKNKYPHAKLYVIGNSTNKKLLEDNNDVDEYIVNDGDFELLTKTIKAKNVDFGCVVVPDFWGLASLYLAGIKSISAPRIKNGYSPNETRFYKIISRFVNNKYYSYGEYVPAFYLNLLEPAGIQATDTKKKLAYSSDAKLKIDDFFDKNNIIYGRDLIIGITPSAGHKIKVWPAERFSEVALYLCNKYNAKVLVLGGPGDTNGVESMMAYLGNDSRIFNTHNMFNIDQLKALISHLDLIIASDTGPIYIAEAFGVATIDIVGPVDEREQPPFDGEKHRIVRVEGRLPEMHIFNARTYDQKEVERQIYNITVEMVIKELDDLIITLKL